MVEKILYFHVPKSAGTSLNVFLEHNIRKFKTHIEGGFIRSSNLFQGQNGLSGHVSFSRIAKSFDLSCVSTLITFREPYSYVISHLAWIRKLADEGQEERFNAHPEIFQKIALKMKEFDFSQPDEITAFILWLEEIKFFYLHNTQTIYLDLNKNIEKALENLKKIDFVGVTDRLEEFIDILAYEFDFEKLDKAKTNANKNSNKYGLDITNEDTRKALLPLIDKDIVVYEEAKKTFNKLQSLYENETDLRLKGFVEETDKICKGWAIYENSHKHVELGLYVDDELVETTIAKIYRKNLKCKAIDNTGNCEFRFKIPVDFNKNKIVIKGLLTKQELPIIHK